MLSEIALLVSLLRCGETGAGEGPYPPPVDEATFEVGVTAGYSEVAGFSGGGTDDSAGYSTVILDTTELGEGPEG